MIKKLVVIGIVIVFLVGSFGSGITIDLTDSVQQTEHKKSQNMGNRDSGLVAHWNFDEGSGNISYDCSGNGNDGIIENATWTTKTPSSYGYALEFDGINDYVEISDVSDFIFKDESVTFSSWIQIVDNLNEYRTFIYLGDSDDDRVPYFFMGKSRSGYLDGRLFMNVNTDGPTTYVAVSEEDGETLPKNTWIHIVGVVDYNNLCINLYINGSLEDSVPFGSYDLGDATQLKLRFGMTAFTTSGFQHKGLLDEIRIYNRALNEDEILYLYNNPGVGDTVYVDDDFNESTPGWGIDHFNKIQDGIDAVNIGGTVYVFNGTYYENVEVWKLISLIGENKNTTIIDGGNSGDVVYVSADYVNISQFTIQNSGDNWDSGMDIRSNYTRIANNIILSNWYGIYLGVPNSNNTLIGNYIHSNDYRGITLSNSCNNIISRNIINSNTIAGIGLWYSSNYNIISDNYISLNSKYAIRLYNSSNGNTISDNNITYNLLDGIVLDDSNDNIISGNNISSNYDDAFVLYDSNNNNILENIISYNNDNGIIIYAPSNNNIISNNTIESNNDDGLYTDSSNNYIYHNNFIDNLQNAYDIGNNIWDNGYPSGGNYWSDYTGVDYNHGQNQDILGHDRIGDTPYNISGGSNQDSYPVMHPYGWLNDAPENITIDGPKTGKAGQLYMYTTSADDPEGDPIYYMFDWGDGSYSKWLGPNISGNEVSDNHSWSKGTYDIKVKAKDTRGFESDWSDPLVVTVPRNKAISNPFLNWLQGYPNLFPLLQKIIQQLGLGL